MRVKFTNPCPGGELKGSSFLNKSKLVFSTTKNIEIICPYNGVIDSAKSDYIVIKHNVNGEEWTSRLKNFKSYVGVNQRVKEGQQVGYGNGENFTFDISPDVDSEELITVGVPFNKGGFFGGDNDSDDEYSSKNKGGRGEENALGDLLKSFLAPVSFVQGALLPKSTKESVSDSKNNLIQEEIKNIKRLL